MEMIYNSRMTASTRSLFIVIVLLTAGLAFIAGSKLFNLHRGSSFPGLPGSDTIGMTLVALHEDASNTPRVSIEFPQFASVSDDFNADIASSTIGRLEEFKRTIAENDMARKATSAPGHSDEIPPNAYSFDASWQAAQINARYVSMIMRYDSYAGGANENQEIQAFNYDVAARKQVTLDSLFAGVPNYLPKISELAQSQLSDLLSAASPGYVPGDMLEEGIALRPENFRYFTFNAYAVTFYFPKYAVAPGAFGEQKAVIPLNAIK